MDLAESILNELVTLQKKNEDLLGIIRRLEHESDVIIKQFEEKIADLNKELKKAQDLSTKLEKKYEGVCREKMREHELHIKEIQELEENYSGRISGLENTIQENLSSIQEKDKEISHLLARIEEIERSLNRQSEDFSTRYQELTKERENEKNRYEAEIKNIVQKYEDSLSQNRTELARKDHDLRTLANEVKCRIADEKRLMNERDAEKKKYEQRIYELESALGNVRSEYAHLEVSFEREREESAKKIQDLIIENDLRKDEFTNREDILKKKIGDLESELDSLKERSEIDARAIEELTRRNQEQNCLLDTYAADKATKEKEIQELLQRIEILTSDMEVSSVRYSHEIALKEQEILQREVQITDLTAQISVLEEQHRAVVQDYEDSVQSYIRQVEELTHQIADREISHQEEISRLSERIHDMNLEIQELTRLKEQHEQEFRDEITSLHEELVRIKEEWKAKYESKVQEITERDRHITLLSGNNEALRSELDRVRSRLLMLEKTIRDEKEEPVHALYRQIHNLSGKLAAKESEISVLASRIIRLDTENTRLTRLLADVACPRAQPTDGEKKNAFPVLPSGGAVSDITSCLTHLEDPLHAMEAASSILRLGPHITEQLIPLLYQGSQQRRAWIAVILYELNDPRATKPLSDLLEHSESGLRELIWDMRLRFREWRRSMVFSSVAQQ